MFKWRQGRQSGGYRVLTLFTGAAWFPVDCHVIYYPVGSSIPPHTDPVEHGYSHHRLNVILSRPTVGGILYLDGITSNSRITYFRPDITSHEVSPVLIGSRMVLSVGWKKKN